MATNERSVELAGVNLAGHNHVCAFFNTMDDEHRVLCSFYKGGFDSSEMWKSWTRAGLAGGAPLDRHL